MSESWAIAIICGAAIFFITLSIHARRAARWERRYQAILDQRLARQVEDMHYRRREIVLGWLATRWADEHKNVIPVATSEEVAVVGAGRNV